jgi:CHAT domain-containing protein/Flp pilus assembly protein TadD
VTSRRVPRLSLLCLALVCVAGTAGGADDDSSSYLAIRRLLGSGQHAKAVAEARRVVELEAGSYRAHEALVDAYEAAGRMPDGIAYLEERLQAQPDDPRLQYAFGLLCERAEQFARALPALRRAAELAPEFPLAQREVAYVLFKLGRLEEARTELDKRLEIDPGDALAHYALGFVHNFGKDPKQALGHLERALALDPDLLDAYRYASQIHLGNGEFQATLALSRELLARAGSDPMYRATALNTLGNASVRLANYAQAIAYYEDALAVQRELGSEQGQWSTLNGLGVICENVGQSEKALGYYGQALRLVQSPKDARWKATTLHNIGVSYAIQRKFPAARRHLLPALKIRETLNRRGDQAYTLTEIGASYARQGDFATGLRYLSQAAALAATLEDAYLRVVVEIALGESHERLASNEAAAAHYTQALQAAARIHHRESEWRAERGLGALRLREGKLDEARQHYARAIETIEGIRHQVQEDAARTVFLQRKMAAYEGMVAILHRLHQASPAAGHDREALAYAQRAKARAFLDLLAEAKAEVRKGMTPDQFEEEQEVLRGIARVQRALLQGSPAEGERRRLEAELAVAEGRLDDFRDELRRRSPEYAALRYPEPEPLERLRSELLDAQTQLLEFMIADERSFAWLVSTDGVEMIALPGRQALQASVERYERLIREPPLRPEAVGEGVAQGRAIYKRLLAPFGSRLDAAKRLVIVPDGVLHYLPFESLVTAVRAGRPRYLLETHDVTYAPSASVLARLGRTSGAARLELLAYGAPDLGARTARGSAAPVRGSFRRSGVIFEPLPHARSEVLSIARLFPPDRRKVQLGSGATESAFKKEDLAQFRILHLATHGLIDDRAPGRSGLLLAPGDAAEDGLLQGTEILNLKLDADMVVLSGCGTGLGKLVHGEGLVGLSRTFFYAGARSLVVSLWNVDDASTAEVMKAFYRRLRQGMGRAEALREAKRDLLRSDRPLYHHPYYWAPLILVGRGESL